MNIAQYISSNVPSLKQFYEPSSKSPKGTSALKALSTVMLLLQRFASVDLISFERQLLLILFKRETFALKT